MYLKRALAVPDSMMTNHLEKKRSQFLGLLGLY